MGRRTARIIALVIVVALVLGGGAALLASGAGSFLSFGSQLDEPTYRQRFQAVCMRIVEEQFPEVSRNPTQEQIRTTSLAAAQQAKGFIDEVDQLTPPDSLQAPHELFEKGLNELASAYTEMADLASKGQLPELSFDTPTGKKIVAAIGDVTDAWATMGYDGNCQPISG